MLDLRTSMIAFSHNERLADAEEPEEQRDSADGGESSASQERQHNEPTPVLRPINLQPSSDTPRVSLRNMIATSVALRANLDIKIDDDPSGWPERVLRIQTSSSHQDSTAASEAETTTTADPGAHVAQAISVLQRQILLLRSELNLELWMSRENVKHIGRLYTTRMLSKNAETERQGLVRASVFIER
jgi:hypothetical protein